MRDDARNLLLGAVGRILVGGPELGGQQMSTGEDVKRQIAIAVIVAVEVPALLLAVDRIVRGVQIDDHARGALEIGLHTQRHEQRRNRSLVVADLVIGIAADLGGVLQPVERRLAGERRAVRPLGRELSRQRLQHRIVPQMIVIVDVLVAQGNAEDALADERRHRVQQSVRIAAVLEAVRQSLNQADRSVRGPEQQPAGVRGDLAAVERAHNPAALRGSEIKRILATVCVHRGRSPLSEKSLLHNNYR